MEINYKRISFLLICLVVVSLVAVGQHYLMYSLTTSSLTASLLNQPTPTVNQSSSNFAILAGSGITFGGAVNTTTITGDIGTYPTTSITGIGNVVLTGTNHAGDSVTQAAKTDLSIAITNAAIPAATTIPTELAGTKTAGVYSSDSGTFGLTGTLTLNAQGDPNAIFIFRTATTLITAGSSQMVLENGAQACNVFWQVGSSATLGAASSFKGNILASESAGLGTTANVEGSVLAQTGAVTLDGSDIIINTPCTIPVNGTCGTASKNYLYTDTVFSGTMCGVGSGVTTPVSPTFPTVGNSVTWTCGGSNGGVSSSTCTATRASAPVTTATLTLVKIIVGGARTFTDFPLTATGPTIITGVYPAAAITNATVDAGTYILSETTQSDYTAGTWSCIKNATLPAVIGASITLAPGDGAICTIQNTYIVSVTPASGAGNSYGISTPVAPLMDIVKIPSPLALPNGPGPVTYTYTLRNIGTVPVNNITMVDDTCSPIIFVSGDTNSDSQLDVNEKWTYDCFKTISATHTNTVVATGWANGVSATDIATATVVVGSPIVPPLIHVTKVPSPLTLPAGGGMVTYTKKVTNPGTVSLTNVQLVDDKCASVKYISGDANNDSKLDPSETWTYTCSANLTKTTTNTVVATGQANGLTARDFAIVTVVVATPALPNTGFAPE